VAGTVALTDFTQEPAAAQELSPSQETPPPVEANDLSAQAVPRKVEPQAGRNTGGTEVGAPEVIKDSDPAAGALRTEARPPRHSRHVQPAPAPDPSSRALGRAFVVGNVLMMFTVVAITVIYCSSLQRMMNTMLDNQLAVSKENAKAMRETTEAAVNRTIEPLLAELRQERVDGRRQFRAEVTNEARKAGREAARDEVAEARLKLLPDTLNPSERKTIASAVAKARTKTTDKKTQAALAAYEQKLTNQPDRKSAYKGATQLLPNLDEPTRAFVEDKVMKTLLGDD
jgi:hypothetical protein